MHGVSDVLIVSPGLCSNRGQPGGETACTQGLGHLEEQREGHRFVGPPILLLTGWFLPDTA